MFSKQIFFLLILAIVTRFIGLNWGDSNFYNPDENNMANSLSGLSPTSLDPHFYAYGQLPVYLGFFGLKLFGLENTFSNSIYALRLISALSSVLSVLVIYKLAQKFSKQSAPFVALLYIFTPGLIQLAHFGTTESILILFYLLIFLLSEKKPLLASVLLGLSIGIKISSLVFALPILFALIKHKSLRYFFASGLIIGLCIFLSSPFYFLNYRDFISSMRYETQVASGNMPVFYTYQFQNSLPYLFQIQKVFPFAFGLPLFFLFITSFLKVKLKKNLILFSILTTSCLYFAYFGQLYTKWFRFMSPLFFIAPLVVGIYLSQFKNQKFKFFLLFLSITPGALFFTRYFQKDPRTLANDYIQKHMQGKIFSEAGNVANLVNTNNFDFYNLDSNPSLPNQLNSEIIESDYIIVPSRRMFANQNNSSFPFSQTYYQKLFSGQLGFGQIKSFGFYSNLFNPELLAEETFTVFDTPTIRIFKKYEN